MPDPPGRGVRAAGPVPSRPAGERRGGGPDPPRRYDDWSFPKGKREPGEHVLETAVREVAEETGMRVILGRPLTHARYDRGGRPKRVDYWVARPVTGARPDFVPNDEVDAWNGCRSRRRRDG